MLLKNKTFWLLVSIIVTIVFGTLYSWLGGQWLIVIACLGFGYCFIFGIIMIVYAVINSIKDIKNE